MGYDRFAEIAAAGMSTEGKHLVVPQPPRLKKTELHSDKNCREAAFSLPPEMDTEEELEEEAERLKGVYRPFFEDCAPPLEERRKKMEIPEFLWRVATEEDFRNFAGVLAGEGKWKKVKIPHYGEPRGVAATYYRTVFCLDETFLAGESLWVCFRGVDYKAHVFLNGMYLGSHEGFFAPFEFEFTKTAEQGENVLCVMVENDYVHMGNSSEEGGPRYTGDKIYGATGPGYDDPDSGWHHCPPGMGVCQGVTVEARSSLFVRDVFVRPCADNDRENAQVWLELYGCRVGYRDVRVELSLYGQNFPETVFEKMIWEPATYRKVGVGDTLSESRAKAEGNLGERIPLRMERGLNELKIPVRIPDARLWEPKEPWLYQVQVRILAEDGSCVDTAKRQFGVRSFQIDTECTPKGRFLLNGRQIRLRGANSMGFGQQCVMRGDWNRLYTDLIYTKACHMNFIRLTQRPVQEEIYDFCDRMGILLQTDLPLFAMLRRSQFAEAVRQAQEMEHLIRSHPSAVLVTYINEPSPNADNKPHRGLTRPELESFFECANRAVKLANPDRAVKYIDGDYDPPSQGFPDNHCYPCWYNGHGIDVGRLHKGYWMAVKEGWNYGCGEYGAEGLDSFSVMKKYYPEGWLPAAGEEERSWSPDRIPGSQTGMFHYFFYDTCRTVEEWIRRSQKYQAEAVTIMTEAFRRDSRMWSFAYHHFIDAFPAGWMKALIDADRIPKRAFFAYRKALRPLMVSLRTDRRTVTEGEKIPVELWICNDTDQIHEGTELRFQLRIGEKVLAAGKKKAEIKKCTSTFQGFFKIEIPSVEERTSCLVEAVLSDRDGYLFGGASLQLEVFPAFRACGKRVCVIGSRAAADDMIRELAMTRVSLEETDAGDVILAADYERYREQEKAVLEKTGRGAVLFFFELPEGRFRIAGTQICVKDCGMLPLHFASRNTGHEIVSDFEPDDVRFWYDPEAGYITPLLERTFTAEGYRAILTSGNQDESGRWREVLAAGECSYGKGMVRICQVKAAGRMQENPPAKILLSRMLTLRA